MRRRRARGGGRRREAGFALLIVLWSLAALSLLATQITGEGRAGVREAASLSDSAVLEAGADGAVHAALFHLISNSRDHWAPDGQVHPVRLPGGVVDVALFDEAGKLDVNEAAPAVLRALFQGLGADAQAAETAAESISDWHSPSDIALPMGGKAPRYRSEGRRYGPPGQPLETLDELKLVRGMTPALFARVLPYLTMHLEQMPERALAAPVVVAALDQAMRTDKVPIAEPDARGPAVVRIVAVARGAGGAAFTRRALVRLDGSLIGSPWRYRILAWGSGEDAAGLLF